MTVAMLALHAQATFDIKDSFIFRLTRPLHRDVFAGFEEMCLNYGFQSQRHRVITDDGYINTMFRILPGNDFQYVEEKPVVLLNHGLDDSSDTWIMNAEESLGFQLVDEGYDVWVANHRGNKYSRSHLTLDPYSDMDYWADAGLIDIAKGDVPANIEYILNHTSAKNLTIVAHSMGTSEMFYNLATNGTYFSDKVNLLVAMAPYSYLESDGMLNLKAYGWFADIMQRSGLSKLLSLFSMGDYYDAMGMFYHVMGVNFDSVAAFLMSITAQTTNEFNNKERIPIFFGHYPCGQSIYAWTYLYNDFMKNGYFDKDMGSEFKNQLKYGSKTPPEVDVKMIRKAGVPI